MIFLYGQNLFSHTVGSFVSLEMFVKINIFPRKWRNRVQKLFFLCGLLYLLPTKTNITKQIQEVETLAAVIVDAVRHRRSPPLPLSQFAATIIVVKTPPHTRLAAADPLLPGPGPPDPPPSGLPPSLSSLNLQGRLMVVDCPSWVYRYWIR